MDTKDILQFCPQCQVLLNSTSKRLVQDSCGHSKCRQCLLNDDLSCHACIREQQEKIREERWKEEQIKEEIRKVESMREKRRQEKRQLKKIERRMMRTRNDVKKGIERGMVGKRNQVEIIEMLIPQSIVSVKKEENIVDKRNEIHNGCETVINKGCKKVIGKGCEKVIDEGCEMVIDKGCGGKKRGKRLVGKIKEKISCDEIIKEYRRNEKLKNLNLHEETMKGKRYGEIITGKMYKAKIRDEVKEKEQKGREGVIKKEITKEEKRNERDSRSVIRYEERSRRNVKLAQNLEKQKPKRTYQSLVVPSHITIISKAPSQYRCNVCNRMFRSNGNIKYHQHCGRGEKPLKCKECGKGFVTPSSLEIHMRSHTGERPYTCDICGRSFAQKSKLDRHSEIHTERKLHVCATCGKKLTSSEGLKRHLLQHTGEKPFRCKLCSRSFSNASNLSKHQAVHAKDKLFMCDRCGKKFAGKWSLVVHKKIHSGKKPYSCDKCQRTFINGQDLARHNDTHLDVKNFTCGICSTKFRRKDNMNRHMKNTHSSAELEKYKKSKTVIKTDNTTNAKDIKFLESQNRLKPPDHVIQDNPNAINVIKTSVKIENPVSSPKKTTWNKNAVPVINAPIKLAFKKDAFKNNYNINKRDFEDLPRIEIPKTYNMAESLNICQRILSPMNTSMNDNRNDTIKTIDTIPKNVITSVGKVNEKDSLEICKRILHPIDPSSIHYETSFENKQHASIKNMKYKINLSTYENMGGKNNQKTTEAPESPRQYTELQPVRVFPEDSFKVMEHQSVIVNLQNNDVDKNRVPPFNEMHWRKRTQYNNMK